MKRYWLVRSLLVFVISTLAGCQHTHDNRQCDEEFHEVIRHADRLVVRHGGYNCCGPVDQQPILLTIINQDEVAEFNRIIEFESEQTWSGCMCCGFPGIDWFRGDTRLALTALQHGRAIRWKGFPGDAELTSRSSHAIVKWLTAHGIAGPEEEVQKEAFREAIAKGAETEIREHIPTDVLEALSAARDETAYGVSVDNAKDIDTQDSSMDSLVRGAFDNAETMYATLFRMLGCLPMHWNSQLECGQDMAHDFLVRAPRDELDAAVRVALQSKVESERQGAARLIFSQLFMTNYGKTDQDIEGWMELLSEAAYSDPFAENRRLVLHRLVEHPSVEAEHVLQEAVTDPDETVRRYAIEALSLRCRPESTEILTKVAEGQLQPRESRSPPKNYGAGTRIIIYIPGMEQIVFQDTDQEAAVNAIRGMH